jgi:hypothetical protein
MRTIWIAALALMASGCSEYNIESSNPSYLEPDAPWLPQTSHTDRMRQADVTKVDVLFVIDNSSSMGPEQAQVTQAFPVFLEYFLDSGLDYHLGVTATDVDRPEYSGKLAQAMGELWIHDETAEPYKAFKQMTNLGTISGSVESGRAAAYSALELRKNDYNSGFRRDDADLHIVAISDDEDQSGNNPISLTEFIDWLQDSAGAEGRVTFNSIVNDPGPCSGDCAPGLQYMEVTQTVGGILWDITEPDWAPVLEQLGMQATGLKREFFLTRLPVPTTIEVRVEIDGNTTALERDLDWEYDRERNSVLLLEFVPDPMAEIIIDYDLRSRPI